MKRTITYTTTDGQAFPQRAAAHRHETAVVRRQRVGEFLTHALKARAESASFSLAEVADAICGASAQFAEVLSARAARRAVLASDMRRA
jgi:hypothetical protein